LIAVRLIVLVLIITALILSRAFLRLLLTILLLLAGLILLTHLIILVRLVLISHVLLLFLLINARGDAHPTRWKARNNTNRFREPEFFGFAHARGTRTQTHSTLLCRHAIVILSALAKGLECEKSRSQ
jgi:hypothetical protein